MKIIKVIGDKQTGKTTKAVEIANYESLKGSKVLYITKLEKEQVASVLRYNFGLLDGVYVKDYIQEQVLISV